MIPPRRASAAGLVRALDDLEPSLVDTDHLAAFTRVGSAKRSLVIVFTDLLDVAAARPLLDAVPVLARHHAVVIASVTDPDLSAAVAAEPRDRRQAFIAAVSQELLDERRSVELRLSAAGATVVDAHLDRFASACVAAYLRLKSAVRI